MRAAFALPLAALLAACAGPGGQQGPKTYDLGALPPSTQLAPLKSVSVRAPMPFDGTDMLYRLAWRDAGELRPYAQSRWAAPPADLLRRQLLRALPEAGVAPCALELELQEFTQVFSAKDASEARLELRASLAGPAGRVAARNIAVVERSGADAAGGAAAFSRAVDRAVAEISAWAGRQAACRS